jgi:hypothetical protein
MLHGKDYSNSHGERPVYETLLRIKWIRTSKLAIKKSLCATPPAGDCGEPRNLLPERDVGIRGSKFPNVYAHTPLITDDIFQQTFARYRAVEPEQWLQRHPEAGSS